MTQTPSSTTAGARNASVIPCLRKRPGSPAGGAPATGGSAVIVLLTKSPRERSQLLLERLRRGRLQRGGDAAHVLRTLEEVLEDLPLALARRAAECDRLEVGHVEADGLRRDQPL